MTIGSQIRRVGEALAATLAIALVLLAAGAVAAKMPKVSTPPPPRATQPPQLEALEQKMEQLQIDSERYSVLTRGSAVIVSEGPRRHGRRQRRSRRVSLDSAEIGEASLTSAEGEVFKVGKTTTPSVIAIGSSLYIYEKLGKKHRKRPWIRLDAPGFSFEGLFPFHGGGPVEVDAGGTGSYAGLINLLSTAVGTIGVAGPVSVQGQPTTEFTAEVEPLTLIKGLSSKQRAALAHHRVIERLDLFVTESGLPIRVSVSLGAGHVAVSTTTEILAVNIPVTIKRPPASETRSKQ